MATWLSRRFIIALVIAIFLIAGAIVGVFMNRVPSQTSNAGASMNSAPSQTSIEKIDDHPLYVMRYPGDYGFQEYLKTGTRSNIAGPPGSDWACTCFAAFNAAGDPIYGRNFDWDNDPILVLFTDSPDGYASITTVDVKYLGITREKALSDQDRQRLLAAPYLPFDGMNEYGLVVGMMAVDVDPPHDANKRTISSLEAIRLMLDYAKTVDEAVDLIGQYNIDFTGGPGIHYLVSDRAGKSVVIEFTGGKMSVLPSEHSWQVATNFVITGKNQVQSRGSCDRYNTADTQLEKTGGRLSMEEAMSLLDDVSQASTLWSVVYNMRSGDVRFTVRGNYETGYPFQLKMK